MHAFTDLPVEFVDELRSCADFLGPFDKPPVFLRVIGDEYHMFRDISSLIEYLLPNDQIAVSSRLRFLNILVAGRNLGLVSSFAFLVKRIQFRLSRLGSDFSLVKRSDRLSCLFVNLRFDNGFLILTFESNHFVCESLQGAFHRVLQLGAIDRRVVSEAIYLTEDLLFCCSNSVLKCGEVIFERPNLSASISVKLYADLKGQPKLILLAVECCEKLCTRILRVLEQIEKSIGIKNDQAL